MYREDSIYFKESFLLTPVVSNEVETKETKETKAAPLQIVQAKSDKG